MDFHTIKYKYGFQTYSIQLWDTAGLEKYRSITKTYFHNANAIILLINGNDPFSLYSIDSWMKTIDENMSDSNGCLISVLITKCDLIQEIDIVNLKDIIKDRYDINVKECSAKTGINVYWAFNQIIEESIKIQNKEFVMKQSDIFQKKISLSEETNSTESFKLSIIDEKEKKENKCIC